jgi:5-methylcytosine-specific restriction endonuclease McrA
VIYRKIHKDKATQPQQGVYSDWKAQISDECYNQCVYCAIHENHWGGLDNYHVEHFRPKSIPAFKRLENDILNLFLACPVCNRFKSDDWPADPDVTIPSYADPSLNDYSTFFKVGATPYTLAGSCVSATYTIERLYLNRPQLIYERREATLKKREIALFNEVLELAEKLQEKDLIVKTFAVIGAIKNHLDAREYIRPYKLAEIRKP